MKLLVLVASVATAVAAVEAPRLGCLLHPDGSLRQVYGVRGSFVISSSIVPDVLAYSCVGNVLLAQTATALLALDPTGAELARIDVSAAKAVFAGLTAILAEETVYAFNVKENAWQRLAAPPKTTPPPLTLRGGVVYFQETPLSLPGEAQSIERMADDWFHIATSQGHFAVKVSREEPEIFALPVGSGQ